jgi:hypothetical protein
LLNNRENGGHHSPFVFLSVELDVSKALEIEAKLLVKREFSALFLRTVLLRF